MEGGVDTRTARIVGEALLAEVRKLDRIAAVSMREIQDLLSFEEQRQLVGCSDESCLAEIAGALGVDELLTGTVGRLGASHVLAIKRLDMKTATTRASISRRMVVADGEEFLAAIGPAVAELYPGYEPRPGQSRGVAAEVVARLNPPPLPRWVFLTTAGAAVAVGLAGGVTALSFKNAQDDYDATVRRSLSEPVPVSTVRTHSDRVEDRALAANVLFAVAGGLALVAVLEAIFTQWSPEDEDDEGHTATRVKVRPSAGGLAVQW